MQVRKRIFFKNLSHSSLLLFFILFISLGGWQPARPRVSASLIREGMEDYEYLYQANCRRRPNVDERTAIDQTVMSIGFGMG